MVKVLISSEIFGTGKTASWNSPKSWVENTFSAECQRAGFQLNTNVYRLCMENKRDLNKIDQRNRLNSSINASTALPITSGSNFSFSYTVKLK